MDGEQRFKPLEITQPEEEILLSLHDGIPDTYLSTPEGKRIKSSLYNNYSVVNEIYSNFYGSRQLDEDWLKHLYRSKDNLNRVFDSARMIISHNVENDKKEKTVYLISLLEIKKILERLLSEVLIIEDSMDEQPRHEIKVFSIVAKQRLEQTEKRITEIKK